MNNEERKAYTSYPCDEEEAFFDAGKSGDASEPGSFQRAGDADTDAAPEEPVRKGKGRRGGNAAASIVVHSGKFRQKPADRDRLAEADKGRDSRRDGDARPYKDDRSYKGGRPYRNERPYGRRGDADSGYEAGGRREFRPRYEETDSGRKHRDRADAGGFRNGDHPGNDRDGGQGRGRDRRNPGERPKSPESVFSRPYIVRVSTTSEIGAFVDAPAEILNGRYGRRASDNNRVLLPFAEQLGRPQSGDEITVYFYEDKGGRLTATMRTPILKDGELGILEVAAVTKIGVFLDNGVPKQVLLPFKEQITKPEVGDEVLVWLYTDKSGRQAATMRVYSHLEKDSPYHEDDRVTGFVYEVNEDLGVFVAVDNKYYGLVPIRETFRNYAYGDEVEARVAKVREDGKLDLLIRDKLYKTVREDADVILYELRRNNGFLPYGDRADAAFIEETYAMSKNQFKRALGHLYKNRIVELDREHDTVRLL